MAPPPSACVVTTTNTPQLAPLHPLPESYHASVVLGFEPATGVSAATTVAEPPGPMFTGAESCNEKLLVIVTVAEVCFAGSARLCAVIVTVAGVGRICVECAAGDRARRSRQTPADGRIRLATAADRGTEC